MASLWMLIAGLSFACMNVFVKVGASDFSAIEMVFYRSLLTLLLAPEPGSRISDPACGSGSLLIKMGQAVPANAKGFGAGGLGAISAQSDVGPIDAKQ